MSSSSSVSFWDEGYWKINKIPFNKPTPHPHLIHAAANIWAEHKNAGSVLVPLCGKTIDLVHLVQNGYSVIGIEGVELAVQQFFSENSIAYSVSDLSESIKLYKSDGVCN